MKLITKIEAVKPATVRKTRVAAYCRVSTNSDVQMVSLRAQKSHYEDYIKSHADWEFAGVYYDEGITGTKKEVRPALMQLVKDCEDGRIDRIITKSLSRFSRNTTDCLELVRKLLDLGVTIYFEKENLDTGTMDSELLLSIMSGLAENESVSNSQNSKWSVRHRFLSGTYKISYAPYGFKTVDGQLEINEEEAKWVRYMFAETLSGKGTTLIARDLNERGIPSRKTGHWTSATVKEILTNEKMVGDCLFQKTYSDERFRRHHNYGAWEQFYAEDHHEPIISREDFEAVARVLQQRAKEKNITTGDGKYQNRYAFSGKIICEECGSTFKRVHRYQVGGSRVLWVCKKHMRDKNACSMQYIQDDDLKFAFVTMMNKLIFARKEVLVPFMQALLGDNRREDLLRINELEQKLEKNEERRRSLATISAKGYLEPALFNYTNNTLLQEAEQMQAERSALVGSINGSLRKTEEIDKLLKYVNKAEMFKVFSDEPFEKFVEKVIVNSQAEVTFVLRCGLKLKERIG